MRRNCLTDETALIKYYNHEKTSGFIGRGSSSVKRRRAPSVAPPCDLYVLSGLFKVDTTRCSCKLNNEKNTIPRTEIAHKNDKTVTCQPSGLLLGCHAEQFTQGGVDVNHRTQLGYCGTTAHQDAGFLNQVGSVSAKGVTAEDVSPIGL